MPSLPLSRRAAPSLDSPNVGLIAGLVTVGTLLLFLFAVATIPVLRRRRQSARDKPTHVTVDRFMATNGNSKSFQAHRQGSEYGGPPFRHSKQLPMLDLPANHESFEYGGYDEGEGYGGQKDVETKESSSHGTHHPYLPPLPHIATAPAATTSYHSGGSLESLPITSGSPSGASDASGSVYSQTSAAVNRAQLTLGTPPPVPPMPSIDAQPPVKPDLGRSDTTLVARLLQWRFRRGAEPTTSIQPSETRNDDEYENRHTMRRSQSAKHGAPEHPALPSPPSDSEVVIIAPSFEKF